MVAIKILMKKEALNSNNPQDIQGIGISNGKICNVYSVSDLYKYLKENPNINVVVENSNSYLEPAMATNGEIYIRSIPNEGIIDSLMKLPRIKV
ncbi:MAG: DUF3892 domain-containing protein [Oscillospiraceae bacterium]